MAIVTTKRAVVRPVKDSREVRSISCNTCNSQGITPDVIRKELNMIGSSLEVLHEHILTQQLILAREYESRTRHVYESALSDISSVKARVEALINMVSGNRSSNDKHKQMDGYVCDDSKHAERSRQIPTGASRSLKTLSFRRSNGPRLGTSSWASRYKSVSLTNSRDSLDSRGSTDSGGLSPLSQGHSNYFGTFPYTCTSTRFQKKAQRERPRSTGDILEQHGWIASRASSRESLEEEYNTCLCGDIPSDWRLRVAEKLWDGWRMPGISRRDIVKYRNRMEKLRKFKIELLRSHNSKRRLHGSPPLVYAKDLDRDAQRWANNVAQKGYYQYSETKGRGENILIVSVSTHDVLGADVTQTWYDECRKYNYTSSQRNKDTKHFTQLIWRSTTEMGLGITKIKGQDCYVIVTQYRPGGNENTISEFEDNVLPPQNNSSSISCVNPDTNITAEN